MTGPSRSFTPDSVAYRAALGGFLRVGAFARTPNLITDVKIIFNVTLVVVVTRILLN